MNYNNCFKRQKSALEDLFGAELSDEDLIDINLNELDSFRQLPVPVQVEKPPESPKSVKVVPIITATVAQTEIAKPKPADSVKEKTVNLPKQEAVVNLEEAAKDVEQKWNLKYSCTPSVARAISPINDQYLLEKILKLKKNFDSR